MTETDILLWDDTPSSHDRGEFGVIMESEPHLAKLHNYLYLSTEYGTFWKVA